MSDGIKITGATLGCVVGILALTWAFQGNHFFIYKVFGIQYENTRREIFEQSRSFNEGMAQELQRMWLDYQHTTNPDEKAAIRSLVVHRVAGYDIDRIENTQLRGFVRQMMQGS